MPDDRLCEVPLWRLAEDDQSVAHEAHPDAVKWVVAGAPGTGGAWWCSDCNEYWGSTIRIMTPEETR